MTDLSIPRDIERNIRRAQAQPGVSELLKVYRRYDHVVEQYNAYAEGLIEEPCFVLSNNTS